MCFNVIVIVETTYKVIAYKDMKLTQERLKQTYTLQIWNTKKSHITIWQKQEGEDIHSLKPSTDAQTPSATYIFTYRHTHHITPHPGSPDTHIIQCHIQSEETDSFIHSVEPPCLIW